MASRKAMIYIWSGALHYVSILVNSINCMQGHRSIPGIGLVFVQTFAVFSETDNPHFLYFLYINNLASTIDNQIQFKYFWSFMFISKRLFDKNAKRGKNHHSMGKLLQGISCKFWPN